MSFPLLNEHTLAQHLRPLRLYPNSCRLISRPKHSIRLLKYGRCHNLGKSLSLPSTSLPLASTQTLHQGMLFDAEQQSHAIYSKKPAARDLISMHHTCIAAPTLLLLMLALLLPDSAEASSLADSALEAVTAAGSLGPAVFVAIYVISTVLLFPASVLTLAAGALYGPLAGTLLVSLASTSGAAAAFLVSRYLARPWVEKRVADVPKLKALLTGVAANGPWLVFLLRLSPLVPFNLLNYALGLTSVPLLSYTAASWAGMLPGTVAYVALGGAGRAAVDAATSGGTAEPTKLVLYGVGAVATVLAARVVSSAASRALEQQQQGDATAGVTNGDRKD